MQDTRAPIATAARKVKLGGATVMVCDDKPTFWARVEAGAWEPGSLAAIARHARPGTQFLDLGAWVGPTCLHAAALGADCVAVEADPAALAELRANLAANPELAARVTVIAAAVSAAAEPVTMAARRKPGDSMSSALLAQAAAAGGRAVWRAPAVTPAQLAARLDPARPLMVKLDIEGGEFALLPHMAPLLMRPATGGAATLLLVSFHPGILAESGAGPDETRRRMEAALAPLVGWRSAAIAAGGPCPATPCAAEIIAGRQPDAWLFARP
ncbi:FkbM family methyltransferase [Camelimonas abortus]|uniref:FkbM family methyltransferase n=1 Tax=Camelimonas abortus TaxID=1017184 RepID=A0ABV7LH76_9HYPH